jgi:hypothetical protein
MPEKTACLSQHLVLEVFRFCLCCRHRDTSLPPAPRPREPWRGGRFPGPEHRPAPKETSLPDCGPTPPREGTALLPGGEERFFLVEAELPEEARAPFAGRLMSGRPDLDPFDTGRGVGMILRALPGDGAEEPGGLTLRFVTEELMALRRPGVPLPRLRMAWLRRGVPESFLVGSRPFLLGPLKVTPAGTGCPHEAADDVAASGAGPVSPASESPPDRGGTHEETGSCLDWSQNETAPDLDGNREETAAGLDGSAGETAAGLDWSAGETAAGLDGSRGGTAPRLAERSLETDRALAGPPCEAAPGRDERPGEISGTTGERHGDLTESDWAETPGAPSGQPEDGTASGPDRPGRPSRTFPWARGAQEPASLRLPSGMILSPRRRTELALAISLMAESLSPGPGAPDTRGLRTLVASEGPAVLPLAALRLGSGPVTFLCSGTEAQLSETELSEMNGEGGRIGTLPGPLAKSLKQGGPLQERSFGLVCSALSAPLLARHLTRLASLLAPRGRIVASGLGLGPQTAAVLKAASRAGLTLTFSVTGDDAAAVCLDLPRPRRAVSWDWKPGDWAAELSEDDLAALEELEGADGTADPGAFGLPALPDAAGTEDGPAYEDLFGDDDLTASGPVSVSGEEERTAEGHGSGDSAGTGEDSPDVSGADARDRSGADARDGSGAGARDGSGADARGGSGAGARDGPGAGARDGSGAGARDGSGAGARDGSGAGARDGSGARYEDSRDRTGQPGTTADATTPEDSAPPRRRRGRPPKVRTEGGTGETPGSRAEIAHGTGAEAVSGAGAASEADAASGAEAAAWANARSGEKAEDAPDREAPGWTAPGTDPAAEVSSPPKRRRGRPPLVRTEGGTGEPDSRAGISSGTVDEDLRDRTAPRGTAPVAEDGDPPKRRRGRPPKVRTEGHDADGSNRTGGTGGTQNPSPAGTGRPRGRPRNPLPRIPSGTGQARDWASPADVSGKENGSGDGHGSEDGSNSGNGDGPGFGRVSGDGPQDREGRDGNPETEPRDTPDQDDAVGSSLAADGFLALADGHVGEDPDASGGELPTSGDDPPVDSQDGPAAQGDGPDTGIEDDGELLASGDGGWTADADGLTEGT